MIMDGIAETIVGLKKCLDKLKPLNKGEYYEETIFNNTNTAISFNGMWRHANCK